LSSISKTDVNNKVKAKAKTEVKAKAKTEVKAKAKTEVKAKAKTEVKAKAKTEVKAKAKTEAEVKAKTEAEVKAKTEAEVKAKTEAKAKAKTEAKAKAKTEVKAKAKTEVKAKAKTEVKAKAKTEVKAKAKTEAKVKAKAKVEVDTTIKKKNKGEKGEIAVLTELFKMNANNEFNKLKVIFGDDASDGIEILDIETHDKIVNIGEIKKAKSTSKTDCTIKLVKTGTIVNISLKCLYCSKPSLLNHTPRSAKVFQKDGKLHAQLGNIDKLICSLNDMRTDGTVGEDIRIKEIKLDDQLKGSIKDVAKFFVFEGTGRGPSKYPCNAIMEILDPDDISKWHFTLCDTDQTKTNYVNSVYDRIVISVRDKGMPKKQSDRELCKQWIFKQKTETGIREKGSLHMRLDKITKKLNH
jgi:hypothetical protein